MNPLFYFHPPGVIKNFCLLWNTILASWPPKVPALFLFFIFALFYFVFSSSETRGFQKEWWGKVGAFNTGSQLPRTQSEGNVIFFPHPHLPASWPLTQKTRLLGSVPGGSPALLKRGESRAWEDTLSSSPQQADCTQVSGFLAENPDHPASWHCRCEYKPDSWCMCGLRHAIIKWLLLKPNSIKKEPAENRWRRTAYDSPLKSRAQNGFPMWSLFQQTLTECLFCARSRTGNKRGCRSTSCL